MKSLVVRIALVWLAITLAACARKTTVVVREGQSIQAAINAVPGGGSATILLRPGYYRQNVDFSGRDIQLRTSHGPDRTTLDAGNTGAAIIIDSHQRASAVSGLTIVRGQGEMLGKPAPVAFGGAILIRNSVVTIEDCAFVGNTADVGGAIACLGDACVIVRDCTFDGNLAGYGGAINSSAADGWSPQIDIVRCDFVENIALYGSAIHGPSTTRTRIINSRFRRNTADASAAVYIERNASVTIDNSVFSGNRSRRGGSALHVFYGVVGELSGCTLVGNAGRPAVHDDGASRVSNTIVYHNPGGSIGGAGQHRTLVRHSCIEGGWTGGGHANVSEPPRFVDAFGIDGESGTADDDLRLSSASGCVDAGATALCAYDVADLDGDGITHEPVPYDVSGRPRIIRKVDIGAHESSEAVRARLVCELTGESPASVDAHDLLVYVVRWQAEQRSTDVDADGVVTPDDLRFFLECWRANARG